MILEGEKIGMKFPKINQKYYIKGKLRIRTFEIRTIVNFKTTNTMKYICRYSKFFFYK